MRRRRPPWIVSVILFIGIVCGLYLLSLLRVQIPDSEQIEPVYIAVKRPLPKSSHRVYSDPSPTPIHEVEDDVEQIPVAQVAVHIVDSQGSPIDNAIVRVSGCDQRRRHGGPMIPFDLVADTSCSFTAARRDGLLTATSVTETLTLDEGPNTVILKLPAARTGGIGVQFKQHDEGMQVLWVMPGTPAARAGLESGDVILEVAGVPVATLGDEEFIQRMTGPEGSDIDFIVGFESDEGFVEEEVTVTRQFLDG